MWNCNLGILALCAAALSFAPPVAAHASAFTTLYSFTGNNGSQPEGGLTALDGLLYGTVPSSTGIDGPNGFVFSIGPSGKLHIIKSFHRRKVNVSGPRFAPLHVGNQLYIVTTDSTRFSAGTAYRVPLAGRGGAVLHYFRGNDDGKTPAGSLLKVGGTFFGATTYGGKHGFGTIYALTPTGEEKVIYAFKGGRDGEYPAGKLLGLGGVLYGTTNKGGGTKGCPNYYPNDTSCGIVFAVTPSGEETILHIFHKGNDGGLPMAGVIQKGDKLVGSASVGGPADCTYQKLGCGTIFTLNADGSAFKVVHAFQGPDGAAPQTPLLELAGTLYGTTVVGGGANPGTIFSLNLQTGKQTVLYSFTTDQGYPSSGLTSLDGTFYGETYGDGINGHGVLYGFTP